MEFCFFTPDLFKPNSDLTLISCPLIPNLNPSPQTHVAAEKGHKEVTSLLLGKGADVEAQNNEQQTPLHLGPEPEEHPLPLTLYPCTPYPFIC